MVAAINDSNRFFKPVAISFSIDIDKVTSRGDAVMSIVALYICCGYKCQVSIFWANGNNLDFNAFNRVLCRCRISNHALDGSATRPNFFARIHGNQSQPNLGLCFTQDTIHRNFQPVACQLCRCLRAADSQYAHCVSSGFVFYFILQQLHEVFALRGCQTEFLVK